MRCDCVDLTTIIWPIMMIQYIIAIIPFDRVHRDCKILIASFDILILNFWYVIAKKYKKALMTKNSKNKMIFVSLYKLLHSPYRYKLFGGNPLPVDNFHTKILKTDLLILTNLVSPYIQNQSCHFCKIVSQYTDSFNLAYLPKFFHSAW